MFVFLIIWKIIIIIIIIIIMFLCFLINFHPPSPFPLGSDFLFSKIIWKVASNLGIKTKHLRTKKKDNNKKNPKKPKTKQKKK